MKKLLFCLLFVSVGLSASESFFSNKKIELRTAIPLLDNEFLHLFYNFEDDSICFATFNNKGVAKSLLPIGLDQLNIGNKYDRLLKIVGIAQIDGVIVAVLTITASDLKDTALFLILSPLQSSVKYALYGFEGKIRDIILESTPDQKISAACLVEYHAPDAQSKLVKSCMSFSKQCDDCCRSVMVEEYEARLIPVNDSTDAPQEQTVNEVPEVAMTSEIV